MDENGKICPISPLGAPLMKLWKMNKKRGGSGGSAGGGGTVETRARDRLRNSAPRSQNCSHSCLDRTNPITRNSSAARVKKRKKPTGTTKHSSHMSARSFLHLSRHQGRASPANATRRRVDNDIYQSWPWQGQKRPHLGWQMSPRLTKGISDPYSEFSSY